jgi:hypothetical protein
MAVSRPRIERYPPTETAGEGGGGGFFSRVPVWVWYAIGAIGGILLLLWLSHRGLFQGAQPQPSTTAGGTNPGGLDTLPVPPSGTMTATSTSRDNVPPPVVSSSATGSSTGKQPRGYGNVLNYSRTGNRPTDMFLSPPDKLHGPPSPVNRELLGNSPNPIIGQPV